MYSHTFIHVCIRTDPVCMSLQRRTCKYVCRHVHTLKGCCNLQKSVKFLHVSNVLFVQASFSHSAQEI